MLHLGVDSLAGDALHFVAMLPDTPAVLLLSCRFEGRRAALSFYSEAHFAFFLAKKGISIERYL